jgi:hypothetical protein
MPEVPFSPKVDSGYVDFGLLVGSGPNKAGRYLYGKRPALRLQLELELTDGSGRTAATDNTRQCAQ